jgi:large subunit ribosomal protein L15
MMIHDITEKVGKYKPRKRVGRGFGSGLGKTSGRGTKGAKSRSGYARKIGYASGAVPMQRRIPKRGFSNAPFRRLYAIVNIKTLDARCDNGAEVSVESLAKLGVVRDTSLPLKVLGEGDTTKKFMVTAEKFSAAAKGKIEAAGGSVTVVPAPKWVRDDSKKPEKAKA